MNASIQVQSVNFRLEPWPVQGETLADFRITPISGTWTLAPDILLRKGIKALLSCPNCGQAATIKPDMGSVVNGVLELAGFQCRKCKFHCHARLQSWDTRKLFCVAYEALDDNGLPLVDKNGDFVRKEYSHAESRQEAFRYFVEVRKTLGRFRVIDVGEVIGFFGLESDKDQKNLTV